MHMQSARSTCSAPLVYMHMHVHLMVHGDDEHALPLRAGVALDTDDPRCAGPTGDRGSGIGDFRGGWREHLGDLLGV